MRDFIINVIFKSAILGFSLCMVILITDAISSYKAERHWQEGMKRIEEEQRLKGDEPIERGSHFDPFKNDTIKKQVQR